MARGNWLGVAVLAGVLAAGVSSVRADIVNGDFSSPLGDVTNPQGPNWYPFFTPGQATVEITGDGWLHIVTTNTYAYDSGTGKWVRQEDYDSGATVYQNVPTDGGNYAPPGTDAIEFDFDIAIDNPAGNDLAYLEFQINYNSGNVAPLAGQDHLAAGAGTLHIDMPGTVVDAPGAWTISLVSLSALNPSFSLTPAELGLPSNTMTITIDSKFDNFQFVPEPASMGLLLVGGAAAMFRRRRK